MPSSARPSRQNVGGGDDLREKAGRAVGDAGHEKPELRPLRTRRQVAQRRITLEHRLFDGVVGLHLKIVVHDRNGVAAGVFGRGGESSQRVGDTLRTTRPGEARDVNSNVHDFSILFFFEKAR